MERTVTRTHIYHADGSAIGGTIYQPYNQVVPGQAEASLSSNGGFHCAKSGPFCMDRIVSCSGSYTHVAGSVSPKSGGWSTLVTSVVEDLNILDVITADRVVARISTEFPAVGYTPKVTLVGSNFTNLRIAGFPVQPVINFKLLSPADDYPKSPWLKNAGFLDAARKQHRGRSKDSKPFKEIDDDYGWIGSAEGIEQRGCVVCSLFDSISGTFPGHAYGHVVDIPEVGRFFLGEFIVREGLFRLTMIRAELGCPVGGKIGVGSGMSNGSTYP